MAGMNKAKSAALRQSVGIAPKNMNQLPREIYQALFFSSTTGDAYIPPARQAGASILANCRPSSLQNVMDPTKGTYKRPEAPLVTRNAGEYAQEFVSRPLEGAELNAALFNLNKQKAGGTQSKLQPPQKGVSETKHQYQGYTHDQASKAIPENYKPAQQRHTDPDSISGEVISQGQKDFAPFNRNQMALARNESCMPRRMPRSKSDGLFVPKSTMAHEFRASQYKEHWPTRFAQGSRTPAIMHGYH